MSAADEAYEAARAEIARVKAAGESKLDFDKKTFRPLDRLPPEIADLSWEHLDLTRTQISDLRPLETIPELKNLSLDQTQVFDITPLQRLSGLQTLSLNQTQISDITPLQGLSELQRLSLGQTQVSDITPLLGLSELQTLWLGQTQVSDITPLQGLSGLQRLFLDRTQVSDIAPLQGLSELHTLFLNQTQVSDIAPLQRLSALQMLSIDQTQVSDITPLQRLSGLQTLSLDQTQISDITPLQGLSGLQALWLDQTHVSDITPLQGLSGLQALWLQQTQVSDLRPLLALPALREGAEKKEGSAGLFFQGCAAVRNAPALQALSEIEDDHDRTLKTLDYLTTLPEWPAPLQKKNADPPRSDPIGGPQDPDIPSSVPAPLQVVEIDGVLRPVAPGDSLDADGHLLAIQGWEALRDYLSDLADQRARIGNNMPRLGKALARLDVSLGETYDAINPVAVGTQGNRVIRLARNAPDMLLQEDADDIAEFAAALALFLERFPDWRAYREAARVHPPDPEAVQSSLPEFEAFAEALEEISVISPEIPDSLEQQAEAVREDPEDEIAAAGIVASLRNVASALGHFALSAWRIAKREGADIGKQTWGITKKGVAAAAATGLSSLPAAAWDIYFNNAKLLQSLAAKFPEQLDWLARLLQTMGL